MPGVSIQLKTPSGQTLLATTDASGAFSFTGLAAGSLRGLGDRPGRLHPDRPAAARNVLGDGDGRSER